MDLSDKAEDSLHGRDMKYVVKISAAEQLSSLILADPKMTTL
jgi:hypothetical protein